MGATSPHKNWMGDVPSSRSTHSPTYAISCDCHGVFCPGGWWQRGCTTHLFSFLLQQRKGGPTRLTLPSKSTVSKF